jgi:hypothetical protein
MDDEGERMSAVSEPGREQILTTTAIESLPEPRGCPTPGACSCPSRTEAERKVIEAAKQVAAECVWEFEQRGSWGAPSNGAVNDLVDALAALPTPERTP